MTHAVDASVGNLIRRRRWMLGMTQEQVASKIGVTFQQLQKYETGANRVSASRLWEIAQALSVPIFYFFDGVDEEGTDCSDPFVEIRRENRDKETLALVNAYYAIPADHRRKLLDLARVLGKPTDAATDIAA